MCRSAELVSAEDDNLLPQPPFKRLPYDLVSLAYRPQSDWRAACESAAALTEALQSLRGGVASVAYLSGSHGQCHLLVKSDAQATYIIARFGVTVSLPWNWTFEDVTAMPCTLPDRPGYSLSFVMDNKALFGGRFVWVAVLPPDLAHLAERCVLWC